MSTLIMGKVWPLRMSAAQKAVAISLADQANDSGVCWPSVSTLCNRTCLSERAVQAALCDLERMQFMTRIFRHGHSTHYHLTPEAAAPPQEMHPAPAAPTPAADAPPPPQEPHPTPAAGAPRTVNEPSVEPSENRKERSSENAVLVFEYWKQETGHQNAKLDEGRRKLISRALKKYSVDDLKSAIDGCKASHWHQGQNDSGKVYDSPSLIFRNSEKIEAFIDLSKAKPRTVTSTRRSPAHIGQQDYSETFGAAS